MGKTKTLLATVIGTKMNKTITVQVVQRGKHPKYGRMMKQYSKHKVHDEKNVAHPGDVVRIIETRPLSKDKRYRLVEVVKKVSVADSIHLKE